MSNEVDRHPRIRVTSRVVELDGRPAIPVTGELHYSRVPRARWEEELRLLAATGLTSVSTYVFWIHHEPVQGTISFEQDLDVAAFVATADRVGLDVVLRIGPWCHGEVRNGGFPDWVAAAAPRSRRDDPEYLRLAAGWFRAIAAQVGRFCGPRGRIVGIQLENELYDQPEHLRTLKRLAREAGLSAPVWTATAWGGAELPRHDVFPLYGGYTDGFWVDQGAGWDDSFRDHFRFGHVWDDPGVGSDQHVDDGRVAVSRPGPDFPPATCELGGGMATAYHRRPVVDGRDVAAVANVKIGNGSAWQGFYMYAGGTNPVDGVQESHASGYPNDMPRLDYDFQAPVGATGRPGPGQGLVRAHNTFLRSFGARLADMPSTLPADAPTDNDDVSTLRWAVRSDGSSGFAFINTHRPHQPLPAVQDVQLHLELDDDDEVLLPDQPIDIPSGVIARWPFRLELAGVRLEWATASAFAVVEAAVPTLVLQAHAGIAARLAFRAGSTAALDGEAVLLDEPVEVLSGSLLVVDGALRVLVVDDALAERLWLVEGELLESSDPVWREEEGLVVRSAGSPRVSRWDGERFRPVPFRTTSEPGSTTVAFTRTRGPAPVPARYGEHRGRSSAPDDTQLDAVAAVWRLGPVPAGPGGPGDRVELVITWEGDVAHLRADGELIADRFWDGRPWHVDLTDVPVDARLTLHVAPLSTRSVVDLDAGARARLAAAGTLCDLLNVRRELTSRWTEVS